MYSFKFSLAEPRLLHVTLDDMGGVKYNRRNAEINAANQAAQRQAQLTANQQLIAQNPQGLEPGQPNLAPPVTGVPKQALNQQGFQTYDVTTGQTTMAPELGTIDQSALKRLMDSGMTEGQARDQIAGLRPEIATTMGNTGLPGGTVRQSAVVSPKDAADKAESDVRARYSRAVQSGSSIDPAAIERDVQAARANALAQIQTEQKNKEMQQAKEANTAGSTPTPTPSPEVQGLQAAMASLSPEEQAILAPLINNLQSDQGISENAARTKALLEGGVIDGVQVPGINTTFKTIQDQIDSMKADRKTLKDAVAEVLKDSKEDTEKLISQQEKAAMDRNTWNEYQQRADLSRQKNEQHNSLIAQYALSGGFGQDAAMAQVRSSDEKFDQAIRDVQTEFGIQRTELAAQFTSAYVANNNNYRSESLKNVENYVNALETLNAQGNQNTLAYTTSAQGLLDSMWKEETRLREAKATKTEAISNTMLGMITQNKNDKTKKQDALWDRLFKQRASDGNLNPELTNNILREMRGAGIDISGIDPNSMTLDQQNEMYRRAKEASDRANAGKTPLGQQVQQLRDADNAFSLLQKARDAIEEYAGVGGPISGMTGLGDADPSFLAKAGKLGADIATGLDIPVVSNAMERQREATASFNLVKQVIGKAMEGGVLRKEDELKYEKLLPTLRDTDRLRKSKLDQLQQYMEEGKRNLLNNMKASGYNTSGYEIDPSGNPYDPIDNPSTPNLTNEEVDEIMNAIENEEPISGTTGFLDALAMAHAKHEGFGTPNAVTITEGNNVGALKFLPSMAEKYGATRGKNNFAMFPDVQSGYKALVADLRAKVTGGSAHIDYSKNPTLLDYIKIYAPDTDGNNPTAYSRAVVASLRRKGYDVNIDTPLSALSMYIS